MVQLATAATSASWEPDFDRREGNGQNAWWATVGEHQPRAAGCIRPRPPTAQNDKGAKTDVTLENQPKLDWHSSFQKFCVRSNLNSSRQASLKSPRISIAFVSIISRNSTNVLFGSI